MKRVVLLAAGIMILLSGISMAGGPEGVSPSGQDVAVINDVCPTFSWTEADGAGGYRVEVYEAAGDLVTHDDVASVTEPVISVDAGRALSWTPSEGGCLTPGVRYVWYVGMKSQNKEIIWSSGRVFEVSSALTEAGREEVKETVEGYLTNEWKTTDSYTQVKEEIKKEITGGVQAETQGTVGIMSPGYEGTTNTLYGLDAGHSISSGGAGPPDNNTFIGMSAGYNTQSGSYDWEGDHNTFIGYKAGYSNTTGGSNTLIGTWAGFNNTTGDDNTFIGFDAGLNNTTGNNNTFIGTWAGFNNTGSNNTFIGRDAGYYNNTGSDNTFMGHLAGYYSRTSENTFVGTYAGYGQDNNGNYSTGTGNAFFGYEAGHDFTSAYYNTFLGYRAGICVETADYNTFVGYGAGSGYDWVNNGCNTTKPSGTGNTLIGYKSGNNLTTGYDNTFIGLKAGYNNTEGNYNTFMGFDAGYNNTTGSGNVFLGSWAGYNETGSDRLYIDNSSTSSPLIYGEFDNDKLQVNGNLTVTRSDGTTQLVVEETSGTTANREVFWLKNNGGVYLIFNDTSTGGRWSFAQNNNNFLIANQDPNGIKASLTSSKEYRIRVGTTEIFKLTSAGNLIIKGTLTEGSSRDIKELYGEVDEEAVLHKVAGLPVMKWRYREDPEGVVHVGPVAEEFHDAFGLGATDKGIATVDADGVALASIKAIYKKLTDQKSIIEVLKRRNEELEKKADALQAENRQIRAENQEIRAELLEKIAVLERQIKLMNTVASR